MGMQEIKNVLNVRIFRILSSILLCKLLLGLLFRHFGGVDVTMTSHLSIAIWDCTHIVIVFGILLMGFRMCSFDSDNKMNNIDIQKSRKSIVRLGTKVLIMNCLTIGILIGVIILKHICQNSKNDYIWMSLSILEVIVVVSSLIADLFVLSFAWMFVRIAKGFFGRWLWFLAFVISQLAATFNPVALTIVHR